MSTQVVVKQVGISAIGLTGLFLVLIKALDWTDLSWWWVTLPFWGGLALIAAFFLTALIVVGVAFCAATIIDRFAP